MERLTDIWSRERQMRSETRFQLLERWRHTTSSLVEAHATYSRGNPDEPTDEDVLTAIKVAQQSHAMEAARLGLLTGDLTVGPVDGDRIQLVNNRDHATEALDILLQQVTVPAPGTTALTEVQQVKEWFDLNAGRSEMARYVPPWIDGLLFKRQLLDLAARERTMDDNLDLGGLTLAQAIRGYAALLSRVELAEYCAVLLGAELTVVWYIEPEALQALLARRIGNAEAAMAFIALLRYSPGRSPASAPIIPTGSQYAIPTALVSPVAHERTLLRAASADPGRAGRLGNALGDRSRRWLVRLRSIPNTLVATEIKVRSLAGKGSRGDLDVVAWDRDACFMLVIEVKWPVDALTLAETNKVDDAMAKGYRQVERLKAEFADGTAAPLWPPGWRVPPETTIHWWVASAQQLDSRTDLHRGICGSTSLRLVEYMLPRESLVALHDALSNPPLLIRGADYDLVAEHIQLGRYQISIPAIAFRSPLPQANIDRRTNKGWT